MQFDNTDQFKQIISDNQKFVIVTHLNPDGDALGSSLGLAAVIQALGKQAAVITPDNAPTFYSWMPGIRKSLTYDRQTEECDKLIDSADVIVYLDFNCTKRIQALGEKIEQSKAVKMLIDHHLYPEVNVDAAFSDPTAPATCELVYKNAKAELCGDRKLGLIKYVMALMNGARLGIAAQGVGISQAAYNEALAYARDRRQFGKAIIEFPAVSDMKAKLDATRALLYETARFVDVYKALDDIAKERKLTPEERQEQKKFAKLADALTPLAKAMGSEYANQNTYDCIQVHGGSGFMKDYKCERIYRDARITSIYEGTTQLQVVAAIRYVTNGSYLAQIAEYEKLPVAPEFDGLRSRLKDMTDKLTMAVNQINEAKNQELLDLVARRLVEMSAHIIMCYLLLQDASKNAGLFARSAAVYVRFAEAEVEKHMTFIRKLRDEDIADYRNA